MSKIKEYYHELFEDAHRDPDKDWDIVQKMIDEYKYKEEMEYINEQIGDDEVNGDKT